MGAGVSNVQKTGNENVDKTIKKMAVLGALKASASDNKLVKATGADKADRESAPSKDVYEFVRKQKSAREESEAALDEESANVKRRTSVLPENFDEEIENENKVELLYEVPNKDTDALISNYCGVCNNPTVLRIDGWPCRVCGQAFHQECVATCGRYTAGDLKLFERAKTPVGWSCENCDNILNLLPQDEIDKLSVTFDEFDINRDSSVSVDEYLAFKRKQWREEEGYDMPPEEENFERMQFRILDADGNGDIDYWEFAKNETCKCLSRMSKENLISMLSPLEKLSARRVYDLLDDDQNGFITEDEARVAFRMWYSFLEKIPDKERTVPCHAKSEMVKPEAVGATERHASRQASIMLDADEDGDRTLTWREFLNTQALYILSSRPNKTRLSKI